MQRHFSNHKVSYKSLKFLGYPKYKVGDDGSVWSCHRGRWKKLSPKSRKRGHLAVCLWQDGSTCDMLVHRLVLFAFVGPCPEGMEACHFPDRDPTNNCLNNLRWDTRKSNHQDRIIHGTNNQGETNGSAKTTEGVVLKVRSLWSTGKYQQKQLAEMLGLTKANVWCIIHRLSWDYL